MSVIKPQNHCKYLCMLIKIEEHTSELQSHHDLVCRLLLEKKKQKNNTKKTITKKKKIKHKLIVSYRTIIQQHRNK